MEWITGLQKAIDYIEEHLTEKLDYEEIARQGFSSSWHFQRVFSILCGCTMGEYIRCRRLTLAGIELLATETKIIDIALKYGYENPDSFTKAFTKFHGITPSAARDSGQSLRSFSRLSLRITMEGGNVMDYRVEKRENIRLVGFGKHFTGDRSERFGQEEAFWMETREKQEYLKSIRSGEENVWYDVITDITEEGHTHWIAVASAADPKEGFEALELKQATCVVCETNHVKHPTCLLEELRRKIVSEWLPSSGYQLSAQPEVSVSHWFMKPEERQKRYIELWLPIEKEAE